MRTESLKGRYVIDVQIEAANFGSLLGTLRKISGKMQKDLHEVLGMDITAISKIESGERRFPRAKLPQLITILDPHFKGPESIELYLNEALGREDLALDIIHRLSAILQNHFTEAELLTLKDQVDKPQIVDQLRQLTLGDSVSKKP